MSEKLTIEERMKLISEVGEEIIGEDQIRAMLEDENYTPIAYDGFEPSGRIHIAQGLLRAINVNKLTKAGIKFKFWIADWFALMNNKMGGDMEKIQTVGKYFIEVWKACGMDMENVEFLWASDVMNDSDYWLKVVNIGRANTVTRITRCAQIMGRSEGESLSAAQIFYPCMQCADIFHLKADIAQLGLDQRKVNVLAREVAPKLGFKKPAIVSHHMLAGLGEPKNETIKEQEIIEPIGEKKIEGVLFKVRKIITPNRVTRGVFNSSLEIIYGGKTVPKQKIDLNVDGESHEIEDGNWQNFDKIGVRLDNIDYEEGKVYLSIKRQSTSAEAAIAKKMSKSNPDTAIFMTDSEKDIKRKMNKAYCPLGIVEDNPVMEYAKYLVFEKFDSVKLERPEKFGGNVEYDSYEALEADFASEKLHPMDLKQLVGNYVNEMLKPVREHFENNEDAKKILELVESYKVTK